MTFERKDMRLVACKNVKSQKGKDLHFVKLADKLTFDNQEFMLSRDQEVGALVPGTDYDMVLDVDGEYSSVSLTPVRAGKL